MHGSSHQFHPADVSDGALAPVRPELRSLKSEPKLTWAGSTPLGRGRLKVSDSARSDRRPPFARNVPKLNRESPGAGGAKSLRTLLSADRRGPHAQIFFPGP